MPPTAPSSDDIRRGIKVVIARSEGDALRARLVEFDTTVFASMDADWRDAGQPKLGRFAQDRDTAALIRAALQDALDQNFAAVEAYEEELLSAGTWPNANDAIASILPDSTRHALGASALPAPATALAAVTNADPDDLPPEL